MLVTSKEVLRVSGLDRVEEGPVGFAGVEQATDSVASEVDEAESDALDPFRELVDTLGWPVRDVRAVPCRNLVGPLRDGATEATNFDRRRLISEVADDLSNPRIREFGIEAPRDR